MPNCPNCGITLGLGFQGAICPKCLTVYTPEAVMKMPGYDDAEVSRGIQLFAILLATGKLHEGLNSVDIMDDAIIITHEEL